VVDVYKQAGLQETVRVAGHWGDTTPRCLSCAARAACCKPSPAYLVQHGDAELVPFDDPGLSAAWDRARAFEAHVAPAPPPAPPPLASARPQAGLLARIHAAAAAHAWPTVRRLAAQVAPDHPERGAVERLRRRAERELLNARAEELAAAGQTGEARRMADLIARRYADLDRAPATPTAGDDDPHSA